MLEVPVARFAKRLARYRRAAHRSPIAVSEHGQTTEVLISRHDFDEYQALKRRLPQALHAWELAAEWIEELEAPLAADLGPPEA